MRSLPSTILFGATFLTYVVVVSAKVHPIAPEAAGPWPHRRR